jgi:quercetin dioxygenase-like cupin family protein
LSIIKLRVHDSESSVKNKILKMKMQDNGLPPINRFITDHDEDGKAVFSEVIPESLEWQELPDGARFCLGYTTDQFPVDLNGGADISSYQNYSQNLPGITIGGGTVLRLVDMKPGALSPMHRTMSLDYGVVMEGEVELILDSGEVRLMRRGDVAIQRGTSHAWRNASQTNSARMLYVLQEAAPLKVGGKQLEEEYGGMPGVRPST